MSETTGNSNEFSNIITDIDNLTVNTPNNDESVSTNDSEKSFESCNVKEEDSEKSFESCSLNIENKSKEVDNTVNETLFQQENEECEDEDNIRPGECRENASSDEEVSVWDEDTEQCVAYLNKTEESHVSEEIGVKVDPNNGDTDKVNECGREQQNDSCVTESKGGKKKKSSKQRNRRGSQRSYYNDNNYYYYDDNAYYYNYGYYNNTDPCWPNEWAYDDGNYGYYPPRSQRNNSNNDTTNEVKDNTVRHKKTKKSRRGKKPENNETKQEGQSENVEKNAEIDTHDKELTNNKFEKPANRKKGHRKPTNRTTDYNNESTNENSFCNNDKSSDYRPRHGAAKSKYSDIPELTSIKVTVERDNIGTRQVTSVGASLSTVTWDGTQFRRDQCQWDVSHDHLPVTADKDGGRTKPRTHMVRHTAPRFTRVPHTRGPTDTGPILLNLNPALSPPSLPGTLAPAAVTPPYPPFFIQPFYFPTSPSRLNQFSAPFQPQFGGVISGGGGGAGHATEPPPSTTMAASASVFTHNNIADSSLIG